MVDARRMDTYVQIYELSESLIKDTSPDLIAGMATLVALLHTNLPHHFWTGFYFVAGPDELHVGPYQGSLACQVLKGQGVCLACATSGKAIVVPDVHTFPGHIACDIRSKSEIALPLKKGNQVFAVLDIDSDRLAMFDEDDVAPLQKLVDLLIPLIP
ncbi:MAG TPA: GAF domain-containing protein [Termitinemataceae bacterium]|jgi:GAF domain-containing protein|uniref:GAF domain-containing protein n=1 Tax=Treponema sp. J25 TaxID=2094121 RepID=UPI00104D4A06|nr:GAF domain-containing protein [Treponema sp. J25]TCW60125.1 diguanylate cyclase [Treponema sp. J25]HOJ98099.1 GAF domain-containing protein [Termitinemataceae bacterium]HOM22346.1 GAF domain-containing protein [Termitinemataceae bacterium]HPP99232.1 GAF domain-containing protein [Termitinemataceae bacterium]